MNGWYFYTFAEGFKFLIEPDEPVGIGSLYKTPMHKSEYFGAISKTHAISPTNQINIQTLIRIDL